MPLQQRYQHSQTTEKPLPRPSATGFYTNFEVHTKRQSNNFLVFLNEYTINRIPTNREQTLLLEMLVFEERGKPEYPEKNLSEQGREQTTNQIGK